MTISNHSNDNKVKISYYERTGLKTERVMQSVYLNPVYHVVVKDALLYKHFLFSSRRNDEVINSYNGIHGAVLVRSYNPPVSGVKRIKGTGNYVLVSRALSDDYYHFFIQTLSAIRYALQEIESPVFILNKINSWKKSLLDHYFGSSLEIMEAEVDNPLYFKKLIIPSISFRFGHPSEPEAWHKFNPDIYSFLKKSNQIKSCDSPRKIYLSRSRLADYGSNRRLMSNACDLEAALEKKGYVVVHPQELAIAQQAGLFYNADIIVGETGSAFSNIVFCNAEVKVVVLQYSTCRSRSGGFALFGALQGLSCFVYNEFDIKDFGYLNHTDTREWQCSVDRVINFLNEIESTNGMIDATLSKSEYKYTSENRY